jgi:hypothetical protein
MVHKEREAGKMKLRWVLQSSVPITVALCLLSIPANAYIGPGGGIAAIGAFLAILAGILVAIVGFVWYPFKRLLRKKRKADSARGEDSK